MLTVIIVDRHPISNHHSKMILIWYHNITVIRMVTSSHVILWSSKQPCMSWLMSKCNQNLVTPKLLSNNGIFVKRNQNLSLVIYCTRKLALIGELSQHQRLMAWAWHRTWLELRARAWLKDVLWKGKVIISEHGTIAVAAAPLPLGWVLMLWTEPWWVRPIVGVRCLRFTIRNMSQLHGLNSTSIVFTEWNSMKWSWRCWYMDWAVRSFRVGQLFTWCGSRNSNTIDALLLFDDLLKVLALCLNSQLQLPLYLQGMFVSYDNTCSGLILVINSEPQQR